MATRTEDAVVNLAGLVQGVTLVTFPAASSVLTDPAGYGLSSSQYGAMFLPQVVTAITTSLLGSRLAATMSLRRVLQLGLAANLAAMVTLILTTTLETHAVAYALLLVATALLGAGFGLTVPVLNTLVAAFQPDRVDRAVLVLNALLGLGTALAPVFVAVFVGLGFWWGLPVLSAVLLTTLLGVTTRLPLRADGSGRRVPAGSAPSARAMPRKFWLFAGFAVLYGVCETMNGNWSQLYMTSSLGATATQASMALTAFWAMVTAGRVLFAAVGRWIPARATYHGLPVVLVAAFALLGVLAGGHAATGVAVFALAGLGCSALLPLTISFGQSALPTVSGAVAGAVIACYQVGYGIAAFGVGPLLSGGVTISALFGWVTVVAVAMALLSFAVAHRQPSPTHLHPLPDPARPAGRGH